MAKILSVFHGVPGEGPGGGQALSYQLCRRLLELGHDVHLAIALPDGERDEVSRLQSDGFTVHTIGTGASGPAAWGQWAVNAGLSALTMSVLRAFQDNTPPIRNFLRGLLAENRYRLVQFFDWAHYRTAYRLGSRRLLVMPYLGFVYRERLAEMAGDPFTEMARSSTSSYYKKNEMKALGYFDHLACFCDSDADFIKTERGKRPSVLPPTYPDPGGVPGDIKSNVIAFPFDATRTESGNSLRWFMKHVWGRVSEAAAEAKLVVGGSVPAALRGDFVGRNVSFVERMEDCLQGAAVSILPSFATSGVRLEIIESLWRGLPVVASPISLEGFTGSNPDNGIYSALYAADFAEAIIDILDSPGSYSALSKAASEYAANNFAPEQRLDEIAAVYETFLK